MMLSTKLNPTVDRQVHSHMMLTPRRFLLALGIVFSLWPVSAYSKTWYVRNDGTGDAPTIQAAIDSSASGDTITLARGTFVVDSTIQCINKSNVVINSEAGYVETRLTPAGESMLIWIIGSTNISVEGISFKDAPGIALSVSMTQQITISACSFVNNGPAVLYEWCDSIDMHDNVLSGNQIGMYFYEADSNIETCNNTLLANASGISINGVTNCSIWNSIISGSSYGVYGFGTNLSIGCNDLFNNGENYAILDFPDPTGLGGNISVDPQFCSIDPVAYNNYLLQSDSPCAPGNHPQGKDCGLIGCKPVGCGTTATERATWSNMKQLFK